MMKGGAMVLKISRKILNGFLATAVGILVIDVLLGVVSRYVFGSQIKWTEELATVLLIWVSLLGIAAAFASQSHLGIDFLVEHFAPGTRRMMTLAGHVISIIFIVVVFLIGGAILIRQALVNWNILPALQVSDVIMCLPLPVSGVFVLIFEIYNLAADWKKGEVQNG